VQLDVLACTCMIVYMEQCKKKFCEISDAKSDIRLPNAVLSCLTDTQTYRQTFRTITTHYTTLQCRLVVHTSVYDDVVDQLCQICCGLVPSFADFLPCSSCKFIMNLQHCGKVHDCVAVCHFFCILLCGNDTVLWPMSGWFLQPRVAQCIRCTEKTDL